MKTLDFSKSLILTAIAVSVLVWSPAQADSGPRSDRERIQTVIIGKFASEMDLSPEQAEQFFPRLRQYQDRLEEIQRGERATRAEMDQLSRTPAADKEQLQGLLSERRRLDNEAAVLKQEFLGGISGFLTPQQVSRCSILLDELPQKVRQFIHEKEREKSRPGTTHQRRSHTDPTPRRRGR